MSTQLAPTSQSSPASVPPSVFTLPQTAQLEALYTIIRSKDTSRGDFLFYSDRIIRLLVEDALNHLPVFKKSVETPTVRPSVCFRSGDGSDEERRVPSMMALDLKVRSAGCPF